MKEQLQSGPRSFGGRVLLSAGTFVLASVLAVACGDDDDGDSGGLSSGNGGSAGSSQGGTGGTGVIGLGGMQEVGGGDGLGGASCGDVVEADTLPVNVLLVIDQSQSMVDNEIGSITRWQAMKDALAATLDATEGQLSYGLKLFPGAPQCDVPEGVDVEIGTESSEDILSALEGDPNGGTPTAAALERALDYFENGAGMNLLGDKYVLLATDGGPNCVADDAPCEVAECTLNIDGECPDGVDNCCAENLETEACLDDDGAIAAVTALAEAGIKTIVVGIPGTEEYETTLNAMAEAGDLPSDGDTSYYAVAEGGGAEGLTDALLSITETLIRTCEFELASQPPFLDRVNVEVDGEIVPRVEGGGEEGWDYADESASPPTVVLQGATCDQVESEGAQTVKIYYGCETVVK
jgi:hypothetical protein